MAIVSGKTMNFPHFDVALDESDHYFIKSNQSRKEKKCFNDANTSTCKAIMKEWKILEKNLPDSIYVQTYEKRLDLLRAVIIGASGTPYHDGLFFFDIVFPSDYPNNPPKLSYLSHGFHMNPNLYPNGRVCLSLINTWHGDKVEKWTPKISTILQLLVSIQGLVLNSKPYFNEPVRVRCINDSDALSKLSLAYNEDVFIRTCKTMLCHIRAPPKNFEEFVHKYFCERREFILASLNAYAGGKATAGEYQGDVKSSSSRPYTSFQFQKISRKMFADLESAIKSLSTDPDKKKGKRNNESSKAIVVEKNKPKIGLMQKIKNFFKFIFER
ncbi:hypothetical protein H5410_063735 [Solanum commersonii]|uniref:UBC core domain-containing protein n=1 Tax=Solanum commersonii TaxID=4109 RepID=A0A9J5WE18_SOLCO|nr:hypothetical protein H5410_063735 [Solanum commersonii]